MDKYVQFYQSNTNNLLIFTHRRKLWQLEHFGTRELDVGGGTLTYNCQGCSLEITFKALERAILGFA